MGRTAAAFPALCLPARKGEQGGEAAALCFWCSAIPSGRWLLAPGGQAHTRLPQSDCPAAADLSLSTAGERVRTIRCSHSLMMRDDRLQGIRQRLLMRRSVRIIAIIISRGFCAHQMHLCRSLLMINTGLTENFHTWPSKQQRPPFVQTKKEREKERKALSVCFLLQPSSGPLPTTLPPAWPFP